jgi:hypothetical protein
MEQKLPWVLEVDLRKYFDTIPHEPLRSFLDRRVTDGVVRRMIDKWLKAGVLEEGRLQRNETGSPQGGVISPLLANIFLHHVLDEWFESAVRPRLAGRSMLVRFADDFVMAFESFEDAQRVRAVLAKRLGRYGLELHADKTRFIDFRKHPPADKLRTADRDGQHPHPQATSFDLPLLHPGVGRVPERQEGDPPPDGEEELMRGRWPGSTNGVGATGIVRS